ncbi:MAG: DNA-directed RNA polymerase subunit alpha C-terminal domain-containing protein [Phycisphaerae bacterium]|nr:DNA-directed RNA polymerase subunit alpha C-terminal domain-containing protein [Phycisphaerae bacterium]
MTTMNASGLDTLIGGKATAGNPAAAEAHFKKGLDLEKTGDRLAAIEEYRKAREQNDHADATFRLAYVLDLFGEEDEAMELYDELAHTPKPPVNALINLAILYEDRGDYVRAERLLKQVLDTDPNHSRARLFAKDVGASRDMYYDAESDRNRVRENAVLDTPVTDFELSVRARNCLKKMQIRTLGDLLKITEAELLSYKNFGETSLVEIKAMLQSKGLRLGQGLEGGNYSRVRKEVMEQLKGSVSESVLNKPISVLELSVRARKALQLLNIASLGELAARTEAELMGVKNFGQTSLEEIKQKMTLHGLGLRRLD